MRGSRPGPCRMRRAARGRRGRAPAQALAGVGSRPRRFRAASSSPTRTALKADGFALHPPAETARGPMRFGSRRAACEAGARIAVRDAKYPTVRWSAATLACSAADGPRCDPSVYGPANFTPGRGRCLSCSVQIIGQPAPGSAERVRDSIFARRTRRTRSSRWTFGLFSLTGGCGRRRRLRPYRCSRRVA